MGVCVCVSGGARRRLHRPAGTCEPPVAAAVTRPWPSCSSLVLVAMAESHPREWDEELERKEHGAGGRTGIGGAQRREALGHWWRCVETSVHKTHTGTE